jgi:glycosyltransferase involved in cell wall biosynthesis
MSVLLAPPPVRRVAPASVPSFSVIIAAFQAAETVGEAVESALQQTLPPHEVIVCDDGSSDGLAAALRRFGDQVRLLQQDHLGLGAARSTATGAASGQFVVILDADDAFHPRRLEALAEAAAVRPDLDILTTDALYEVDGVVVQRCYESPSAFVTKDQRQAILCRNFIFGAAAIRRARLLEVGGFDASFRRLEDWDCWIRLLLSGSAAGLVYEPLYRYRVHRSGLSYDRAANISQCVRMLERVRANPHLRPGERPLLERSIAKTRGHALAVDAEEALLHARPGRRRRLASLATAREVSPGMRAKAIAAVVTPALAARRLARRGHPDEWMFERATMSKDQSRSSW